MLRAIGMSRRQVRTMIRYEAVITALIGAILGIVLGVIFAALIAQPLKSEGFTLSYPVPTLIGILVLAALAGVIAAIVPARRASRLDVLESLQYEYAVRGSYAALACFASLPRPRRPPSASSRRSSSSRSGRASSRRSKRSPSRSRWGSSSSPACC